MKVLVVDDSSADRMLLIRHLNSTVLRKEDILEASNISEALECIDAHSPGLVLLDYHLPDGTAEEFLNKLTEMHFEGFIEVAVITGQDDPEKSRAALNNGAIDYLTKEMITASTLPVIIRNLIEKIQLKRELDERKRELEAFTYRVSHDLRGVFGNIAGAAELIKNTDDLEEVSEIGSILEMAVGQATRIIHGLYDLSQVKMATTEDFKPVVIEQLLDDAVLSNQDKFAKAVIHADCPHLISCSGAVFPQVFQNLLDNTFKFSGRDDVEVSIKSEERDDCVYITYEDNGPGIPSEVRGRLFEAFQAHHRKGQKGLGLGMNIVKRIIDVHGGRVELAEPKSLGGASFEFILPICHKMDEELATS